MPSTAQFTALLTEAVSSSGCAHHDALHAVYSAFLSRPPGVAAMLVSGITAQKELCLVADHGRVDAEGGEVALEPCEDAVREGDGREIWMLDPSGKMSTLMGKKCLSAPRGAQGTGKKLELTDCDLAATSTDRKSQFEMSSDSRIYLAPKTNLCLTIAGKNLASGLEADVAKGQAAEASSSYDSVAHTAARAVDGNPASYWASAPGVSEGSRVALAVPFKKARVNSVDIDWEIAPRAFEIETSEDGYRWVTQYAMDDLPPDATHSHVPLYGLRSSGVRLLMTAPHPGKLMYGVRSIRANSPVLTPVVDNCKAAAKLADARDRWFLSSVAEFEPRIKIEERNEMLARGELINKL